MLKLELWGNRAMFTRPEFSMERVSYDVPTPTALVGIIESIYWHPGIKYTIHKIIVLNEIKTDVIFENQVGIKGSLATALLTEQNDEKEAYHIDTTKNRVQKRSTYLKDIHYLVEFSFSIDDKKTKGVKNMTDGKVISILKNRLQNGRCFQTPYFGIKEMPVKFREFDGLLYNGKMPNSYYKNKTKYLGAMVCDMDYCVGVPTMYYPVMVDGVIDVDEARRATSGY